MALFLSSPSRLCWFDYMQKPLANICDMLYDYRKHLRSCCFSLFSVWSFIYLYHLILFPVVSLKLSLLGSVDVMVIDDLVE